MNMLSAQMPKSPVQFLRILRIVQNYQTISAPCYTTTVEALDIFAKELLQRHRCRSRNNPLEVKNLSIRYFMDSENAQKDIKNMTTEELDEVVLQYMSKNKDTKIIDLLKGLIEHHKHISDITVKKLYRHYSIAGKSDIVVLLQKYSLKVYPQMHKHNGKFMHYLAKAQCMRGNSEKGLSILTDSYKSNEQLRGFYRLIFRELIQDSVLNRSEASLVIFKKYVLEFSNKFGDHYPLVCFWHLCWSSSWFSDQNLSTELLESSVKLQEIIRDRATAFSITILREEFNDDAVFRLLQTLLKYEMMEEYAKVLQVLFNYKLRIRDARGCTEVIRNCETLGIALPTDQQKRFIKMLIDGKHRPEPKPTKLSLKNFKLKF